MAARRALVVGASAVGLACAYRLLRSDWDVVLLPGPSSPPDLPEVLTGTGLDAARRLGLLPELSERRQPRRDLVRVDTAGVPLGVRPRPKAHQLVLRQADVVEVLRGAVRDSVFRRDADLAALSSDRYGTTVQFTDGDDDWFDLVIGAGGNESGVGAAIPAAQHTSEWSLASGVIDVPSTCAVAMDTSTRSVRLHPLHEGRSAVSFAWQHGPGTSWPGTFADLGWLVPELVARVDASEAVHRHTVSLAETNRWTEGSVVLLGNAAWCLGPHSGQEISLALGAAELLGDALDIHNDTNEALAWWERVLVPFVRRARARNQYEREATWDLPSTRSENSTRSRTISRRTIPSSSPS
ncbi:FAD-dependent monooxygenase [Lentzea sp. NPDC034063]|uniref:FAD-dependent oxidoreductase n=1 Tax=unclassified Lentzea TaxID=2643253 RepID=UPI0033DF5954